jgi:hypothetical protein
MNADQDNIIKGWKRVFKNDVAVTYNENKISFFVYRVVLKNDLVISFYYRLGLHSVRISKLTGSPEIINIDGRFDLPLETLQELISNRIQKMLFDYLSVTDLRFQVILRNNKLHLSHIIEIPAEK